MQVNTADNAEVNTTLHHIVIVGGGAGGLELATRLGNSLGRKGKAAITLIDKSRTHVWKPLLHEIAAGSMNPEKHELEYMAQAHWHQFRFRLGSMDSLDRAKKEISITPFFDEYEYRRLASPQLHRAWPWTLEDH